MTTVFADISLARRLEHTEGRGNAAFVDAQARIDPASGAIWTLVGGTSAMFAGVGSPITQTFGLGVHQPLADKNLDTIEHFFRSYNEAQGRRFVVTGRAGPKTAERMLSRAIQGED